MKVTLSFLLFLFYCFLGLAQITGTVSDTNGKPLPHVNIYLKGSFSGTTSNENGKYELEISEPGNLEVVFQYLGYRTRTEKITTDSSPMILNVELEEESTTLEEVVLDSGSNPANAIMRKAIENRQYHKNKITQYTADFYSRGISRIANAPEKILGQEVGDLGGGLDTTRSGIIYLSETISEITYRAPNDFKEKILASKVSGQDNGFSLNSAQEATISFYTNTVTLNSAIISPLADYAFNYYGFRLEGAFYNDRGNLVNKIRVIPKRPKDKVFTGLVYIEEDSWQLFGLELRTTGEAIQVPPIEALVFNQNFNYSEELELWVPISQTVDFSFGMFGIEGNGRFTAVYSNYNFSPGLDQNTFSNEILSFGPAANKKDSLFWEKHRPVPLTLEEELDYLRKDSIQEYRNSPQYLDSIDKVRNKPAISDLLTGYTYRNSREKWVLGVESPITSINTNTVQGYNMGLTAFLRKTTGEMEEKSWRLFSSFDYGFSDERFRVLGGFEKEFNNFSRPVLKLTGGNTVKQFNHQEPISENINGIATIFFERNYMKLYDLQFAKATFEQEVFNGFQAFTGITYEERSPLYNSWDSPWINRDQVEFTSNNPLQPYNYGTAPFEAHHIFRFQLAGRMRFDQKYLSYPDGKYNIPNNRYPSLSFSYEKGFGAEIAAYNFDHLQLGLSQIFAVANKGELGYNLKAGTFFNTEGVSFIDHRHFNGNQTRVGVSSKYLNNFNLLPYYEMSTTRNYAEAHMEHDFKGWVLGKLPLINTLNYNLVIGAHQLIREDRSPYTEFSIGLDNLGIGKFRFLRLDYVTSLYRGNREGAFIFGLKFLNMLGFD